MEPHISSITSVIKTIETFRDTFAHQVSIDLPVLPWEDDKWVSLRESKTIECGYWLESQGYMASVDWTSWNNKVEFKIVFGFHDGSLAMLFKLACGGNA